MIQKNIATIKILDEINIVIIGLTIKEYEYFYNKFGIFDKGYNFKPAYTLGRWDGKIRLFSKTGKTSIHFIDDIVPDIKAMGYKIRVIDNRNPVTFDVPNIDANTFTDEYSIILEPHQVECVNQLLENRGGIVVAATASGKSYVIGALCKQIYDYTKLKCLVIVPSMDLVTQTAAEIKLFGNDTGMYYSGAKELKTTHLVSTWQSLQNSPEIMSLYNVIIIDEAHGAKSSVLKSMLLEYGSSALFICGVTGTLPKHQAEAMQVKYVLGNQIANIEAKQLIDIGWLAKPTINSIQLIEDFEDEWKEWNDTQDNINKKTYAKFKETYFVDYDAEKKWIKTNKYRNTYISRLIIEATKATGNSFVLVNGVDFGKRLAKMIPNAIYVYGKDDTTLRKQIYDLFSENNDVIVIATFKLASTGLNIKRIFNLFLLDANKSFVEVIQSIGRGLRTAHDKTEVTIWDISSDLKYSKKHLAERKKFYKEKEYASVFMKKEYKNKLDKQQKMMIY